MQRITENSVYHLYGIERRSNCRTEIPPGSGTCRTKQPSNRLGEYRALAHQLMNEGLKNPLVFFQHYAETETENLQIKSAADMGAHHRRALRRYFLFNQTGKEGDKAIDDKVIDTTAFGILQAGRIRTSKTEYISCPGCGRTLYDLEAPLPASSKLHHT